MFHLQEKVRFLNPETPFQYFVDGLRFNVGPCVALDTNIDTQQEQQSKHVILRSSRPKAVTITNIVRDAVCRLREPGSHIQIMQLVLQSQYIKPECDQRLLGILINFSLHQLKQAFSTSPISLSEHICLTCSRFASLTCTLVIRFHQHAHTHEYILYPHSHTQAHAPADLRPFQSHNHANHFNIFSRQSS
eukprot:c8659_g1_i1.p1 GENE.c8659_g1_i1~~c8659_g1_i1.p1  ORF type:complete len:190 (-),score=32.46 c8659_g1_i1:105-674(-)